MPFPNLNALRSFDAAARALNFRHAARELNVTQGAVAQQVRALEADLGVRLFDRHARGLMLTEAGKRYHRSIGKALALIADATADITPEAQDVRISVTPSFASKWLVPRLGAFAAEHPHINLETTASEALANFRADGIDIAIRQSTPPFGGAFETVKIADHDLRAIAAPGFVTTPPTTLAEFANFTLVQDSHRQWERLLTAADITPPKRILQLGQTTLAMDAALNGQGIAIAPAILAHDAISRGALVSLWQFDDIEGDAYYALRLRSGRKTDAITDVIAWLVKEAAKHTGH
ncbi:MAG: LysR substrate-binding domain-containing protein [Pikeienuella sp.]